MDFKLTNMKKHLILIFLFLSIYIFSQNIKCETTDYVKNINNREYSTYQYINSSYSQSRPLIIFITSSDIFMKVHEKVPIIFSSKQEYTDVYLLGIKNFNKNNIDQLDEKIIKNFINDIIKYRNFYNLQQNNIEFISSKINYLEDNNLCKFLNCKRAR